LAILAATPPSTLALAASVELRVVTIEELMRRAEVVAVGTVTGDSYEITFPAGRALPGIPGSGFQSLAFRRMNVRETWRGRGLVGDTLWIGPPLGFLHPHFRAGEQFLMFLSRSREGPLSGRWTLSDFRGAMPVNEGQVQRYGASASQSLRSMRNQVMALSRQLDRVEKMDSR
jgi:hypothetical protein